MKNRYRPNISTLLVTAMFILSLFSGIAAAQAPEEQYGAYKDQYRMYKEKYDNTREKFERAKELFEKANREFRDAKVNKSRDELKLKTREYLGRAIDHITAHLEILKYRVELPENKEIIPFNASDNINAHIAQLEQLRTKVQQANTPQELRDAYKELKDAWVKIRLETRYYFEIILNHRIDRFIAKSDNVSEKVNAAIQNMKSQGKDTTKLEEDAANYKNLMEEAKSNQRVIDDLLLSHTGFASDGTVTDNKAADEFVRQIDKSQRETIKKLKSVSKQLIEFVRDFRKLSGEKAGMNETQE